MKKFLQAIGAQGAYSISHDIHSNACSVTISCKQICDDLRLRYGIRPRKTSHELIPSDLPAEFLPHFIRGYMDGDGCITRSGKIPVLSFTGAIPMMQQLAEIFYNEVGVRLNSKNRTPPMTRKREYQRGQGQNAILGYSGKNACLILEWLYADSTVTIRMGRKYKRWLAYFRPYRKS
jgi:hypothetical protein